MDEKAMNNFWYWIQERHRIYNKRKMGVQWPWTKDEILQNYRFCNVYRELDKVTKWIRENWRDPYEGHPNLWFAMCVARQINEPATLNRIGFPEGRLDIWVEDAFLEVDDMVASGEKVYNSAYIITNGGESCPKHVYTFKHVLKPLAKATPVFTRNQTSLKNMWMELKNGYLGFGPFIAYEVVTDLRWTQYYNGEDHMTWANAGPGALRGLGRIFFGSVQEKPSQTQALIQMQRLLKMSRKKLKKLPEMEMRDIEHSLCETDKYLRVLQGEGTPKQKYRRV